MDKIGHNEPKSNKISNNGQNWIIWTKTGQNRQNEPKLEQTWNKLGQNRTK